VTGPLDYDFDEWKIQLRFDSDVNSGPGQDITAPSVSSIEVITETVIKVQFSEEVEVISAETESNYSISNDITVTQAAVHSIIKSQVFLTTTQLIGGSHELTIQNIADLSGNIMTAAVVMPFTTTYGVDEAGNKIDLKIYPNPAHERLSIDWTSVIPETITVSLTDLTGRKVYSAQIRVNGSETLSINY
jgi:hypothetical protein